MAKHGKHTLVGFAPDATKFAAARELELCDEPCTAVRITRAVVFVDSDAMGDPMAVDVVDGKIDTMTYRGATQAEVNEMAQVLIRNAR